MIQHGVPLCEKDGNEWVLIVPRAPVIRTTDRELADKIWRLATWAHHNGDANAKQAMRMAMGVES